MHVELDAKKTTFSHIYFLSQCHYINKKTNFQIAAKQKVEKQKADAIKLKSEVEQRKRQLLDKQMQQLKVTFQ